MAERTQSSFSPGGSYSEREGRLSSYNAAPQIRRGATLEVAVVDQLL
jgi:hypothetical protein